MQNRTNQLSIADNKKDDEEEQNNIMTVMKLLTLIQTQEVSAAIRLLL